MDYHVEPLDCGEMEMIRIFKKRAEGKRSPITAPPLRYAGQSLDEEIQKIIENKIDDYAAWGGIFLAFTFYEWFRWYFNTPPKPVEFTFAAVLGCGYVAFRIRQYKQKIRLLRQARDGEYIFGMLFLKRLSDLFDQEREQLAGELKERGMADAIIATL